MQAEASQMAASSQLPEAQEQALDEYPMPDEQVSTYEQEKRERKKRKNLRRFSCIKEG